MQIAFRGFPDIIGSHFFERFALAATLRPDGACITMSWADSIKTVYKTQCWCGLGGFHPTAGSLNPWGEFRLTRKKI
jgi:hypothetical protein